MLRAIEGDFEEEAVVGKPGEEEKEEQDNMDNDDLDKPRVVKKKPFVWFDKIECENAFFMFS